MGGSKGKLVTVSEPNNKAYVEDWDKRKIKVGLVKGRPHNK